MKILTDTSNAFMGTLMDLINDNNEKPIIQILMKDNRYLYIALLVSVFVLLLQ